MKKDTKRILLNAARKTIDLKGIKAVSMRELGRTAGLSRTAIYSHFDSKESLLAAIVLENFEVIEKELVLIEKKNRTPDKILVEFCLFFYDFGMNRTSYYQLMFNHVWDKEKYPLINENAYSIYRKIFSFVTSAIVDQPVDDKEVMEKTAILFSFIHGLVQLHINGHTHIEKGLQNAKVLIEKTVSAIIK